MKTKSTFALKLFGSYLIHGAFFLSVFLFVFTALGAPVIKYAGRDYTILSMITDRGLYEKCRMDPINNSFLAGYAFDASKWYATLLPVITAIPALFVYDKIDASLKTYVLSRISRRKYCLLQLMTAFLTGFSVVALGVALYYGIVSFLLPAYDMNSDILNAMASYYGYSGSARFTTLAIKVSNSAVAGGLMAAFSLVLYHLVHDKFLVITIPMMIMYISDKLYYLYDKQRFANAENYDDIAPAVASALFPSNISRMFSMMGSEYGISYAWFLPVACILFLLIYMLYRLVFEKV